LRGAPLLLSPADWKVTQRWHQQGIPLDLVRRTHEEVFTKRKERKAKGSDSSLRYCAPAVEAAWAAVRELLAGGERAEAESFQVVPRLASLAAALPADFGERQVFASRIVALEGNPQAVEESLSRLDGELLEAAWSGLEGPLRGELDAAVESSLDRLRARLPAAEVEEARQRLRWQTLRRALGLPVLSLFAPEAEAGSG
jgi:hypothetical protein